MWYFSLRLANRDFTNRKANAMIFAWFARILNILKSCLNRSKIVLNSSAESISEALRFFTRAVQISKVFSLLIWVLTVEFKFCMYYFLVFILDELWSTFMFNFDLICTDQHIIKTYLYKSCTYLTSNCIDLLLLLRSDSSRTSLQKALQRIYSFETCSSHFCRFCMHLDLYETVLHDSEEWFSVLCIHAWSSVQINNIQRILI